MIKKVYLPFVFFLLLWMFSSAEVFIIVGAGAIIYNIVLSRSGKFMIEPVKGYKILLFFLIWGSVLGIVNYRANGIELRDIIRDLFYYISPLIFIQLGAVYCKKGIHVDRIYNSLFLAGMLSFIFLFYRLITHIPELISLSSARSWRQIAGNGNILGTVSLVIILTRKKQEIHFPRWYRKFMIVAFSSNILLTLSRTDIMVFIAMMIGYYYNKTWILRIRKNAGKILIVVLAAVGIFAFVLPSQVKNSFIEKMISSFAEIGVHADWSNASVVQSNWRGYEAYSAIQEWLKFDPISMIIGRGFGKRVYVGKYAYLFLQQVTSSGAPATTIPVLHNGYATMLVKLGVMGVILYLGFYIIVIKTGIKKRSFEKSSQHDGKMLVGLGLALLLVTYFLNGLFRDGCPFFPLVFLIGFHGNHIKRTQLSIHQF